MHKLLLTFILLVPCLCNAQPKIDTDIIPTNEATFTAQYSEATQFDSGAAGPNQAWDFSQLTGQLEITFEVLFPNKDLPGADSFPKATFAWHFVEFETYHYFEATPDSIAQLGSVVGNQDNVDILVINRNPEDGYHLPINYLDNYLYDAEYETYIFGNLSLTGTRSAELTADAYGTITTPYGTYDNVMRVKLDISEFGALTTQYAWLLPSSFLPVLLYEESDDSSEPASYYYTDLGGGTTSTRGSRAITSDITAYQVDPNTVRFEQSNADFTGFTQLIISDALGRIVYTQKSDNPGAHQSTLDIPDLAEGIYYIVLRLDNRTKTVRLYLY